MLGITGKLKREEIELTNSVGCYMLLLSDTSYNIFNRDMLEWIKNK